MTTESEVTREQALAWVESETVRLLEAIVSPAGLLVNVLRFHLVTENLLERIVLGELERGDKLIEHGTLSYYQKLCVIEAFDVIDDRVVQSLKHLNSIRNKCSHVEGKEIMATDIDLIGRPFGKVYSAFKRQHAADLGNLMKELFRHIFAVLLSEVGACELLGEKPSVLKLKRKK